MRSWFKWYAGSTTDIKFPEIAASCSVPLAFVIAIWAYLLERAHENGGSIDGLACTALDQHLGMPKGTTECILNQMIEAGLVTPDMCIKNWEKLQSTGRGRSSTGSAKSSTERVREYRKRQKNSSANETRCNVNETYETRCNVNETYETHETQCNAQEEKRIEERRREEKGEENISAQPSQTASRSSTAEASQSNDASQAPQNRGQEGEGGVEGGSPVSDLGKSAEAKKKANTGQFKGGTESSRDCSNASALKEPEISTVQQQPFITLTTSAEPSQPGAQPSQTGSRSSTAGNEAADIAQGNEATQGNNVTKSNVTVTKSNDVTQRNDVTQQPFITLTTNTGAEYPVYDSQIEEWQQLYPAVDVQQELRNMRGWCMANAGKRKTEKGMPRFINSWLASTQNKGGSGLRTGQSQVPLRPRASNEYQATRADQVNQAKYLNSLFGNGANNDDVTATTIDV